MFLKLRETVLKRKGLLNLVEEITEHHSIRMCYGHHWLHLTRFAVRVGS